MALLATQRASRAGLDVGAQRMAQILSQVVLRALVVTHLRLQARAATQSAVPAQLGAGPLYQDTVATVPLVPLAISRAQPMRPTIVRVCHVMLAATPMLLVLSAQ